MSAEQDQGQKSALNALIWLVLLTLLGAAVWGIWVLVSPKQDETPAAASSAFNLPEAPKPESRPTPAAGTLGPNSGPRTGAVGPSGGPGLAGFVPESSSIFVKKPQFAAPDRAGEQEFLKRYDPVLLKYQERVLAPLTDKYWKKSPIVREVDSEFTKLDRYMALTAQYGKDRDAYKWARGVIALPEVRKAVMKYALNPEVWKVGMQMSLEALKNPPPKPIYDEMQRFLTADKDMSSFVGDFSIQLVPHMGQMAMQAATPGMDMGPLQSLASRLAPENVKQAMAAQPPPPRQANRSRP